jgi:unsaturated rhamnogalacturonyl hydrolase
MYVNNTMEGLIYIMDIIVKYIDELLEKSTVDAPMWNIEKIKQGLKSNWNYIDGVMIKAVLEMYFISKDEKYLKFADDFIDHRVHDDGSIEGYDIHEKNIDNVNAGKTLFELYNLVGKEKYRKAIDLIYNQIAIMPRTEAGSFWHKDIYPNQVWLDGLYMGMPFYMEYETRYNGKKNYDDIFRQFRFVINNMKDLNTGLYYHAIDTSKKIFWCDRVTGLSQLVWLRAIGWFSMALLDTLDKCDRDDAKYADDIKMMQDAYVDLMDTMIKYQDESGMWYQVVNYGGLDKNYLETSGSSIMAYALLKGVRLGYLPESYRQYAEKAIDGITSRYLKTTDGELHLGGICLVAGLGGKTERPGTYDYYMSEPIVEDDAKGVGPFLLAYTELLRYKKMD